MDSPFCLLGSIAFSSSHCYKPWHSRLLTKENYFFKGSTQAALVKLMPPVCEGQFAEGKVIRPSSQASWGLSITYMFRPCIKSCVTIYRLERLSDQRQGNRKGNGCSLIRASPWSEFSEFWNSPNKAWPCSCPKEEWEWLIYSKLLCISISWIVWFILYYYADMAISLKYVRHYTYDQNFSLFWFHPDGTAQNLNTHRRPLPPVPLP